MMLKPMGKSLIRNRIFISSGSISHKTLINCKWEKQVTLHPGNLIDTTLPKCSKLILPITGNRYHLPFEMF